MDTYSEAIDALKEAMRLDPEQYEEKYKDFVDELKAMSSLELEMDL